MLPLLNRAARLGLPTPKVNERGIVMVSEIDHDPVGMPVDAVSDIIAPTDANLKPPPETVTGDE